MSPPTPAARNLLSDDRSRTLQSLVAAHPFVRCELPVGAAEAAFATALVRDPDTPCVLAVAPTPIALETLLQDAQAFREKGENLRTFPILSREDPESTASRLSVLRQLLDRKRSPRLLLLTCVQALLQPSPDPRRVDALCRIAEAGAQGDPEHFAAWLENVGYRREPEVFERGTWARKGGIVDVWPVGAAVPSRLEFFDDQIESVRSFDPATQRSDRRIDSVRIPPAQTAPDAACFLHDSLPPGSITVWLGGDALLLEAEAFLRTRDEPAEPDLPTCRKLLAAQGNIQQVFTEDTPPFPDVHTVSVPLRPAHGLAEDPLSSVDPEIMLARRRALYEELRDRLPKRGKAVLHLCLESQGASASLAREAEGLLPSAEVRTHHSTLSRGFEWVNEKGRTTAVWLSQADLYGVRKRIAESALSDTDDDATLDDVDGLLSDLRPTDDPAEALAARIVDAINPGDVVVHAEHGIGRYLGTKTIEILGKPTETMVLEYAGGSKLNVPLAQAGKVTRYMGVGDVPVRLHTLSGKRWSNEKTEAVQAIQELAHTMLLRQARRKQLPGHAYEHDTPYYDEFEASFPYKETKGQAECIRKVREDLESTHPMDRLICGDAGYGKTEVAIRAAFIVAMQGRQVAVLVPTTVLAQQHYDLFRNRFAPYPLRVALHSRFLSPGERTNVARDLASGAVDIVIGTHGILRKGVSYKDLGLVIIDEEQRFGVRDKERLKEVSEMVDVLTLSATPIPRTLYLGLMGARDLSLLRTPPRGRIAIQTNLAEDADDTIRAVILREVSRGGQVFFLHNRVQTIGVVEKRLRTLLPHLRIGVGHGQMPAGDMERVMRDFSDGLYDILLSTTIVENGIDVPRANTILVDRADRFGIADLYQLRGRVGRGDVKAYAVFLVPKDGSLTEDARERLEALCSGSRLGAGVSLALRDLSIRGSGNLLGAEQSGHISAIGFSLYCQLLRRTRAG